MFKVKNAASLGSFYLGRKHQPRPNHHQRLCHFKGDAVDGPPLDKRLVNGTQARLRQRLHPMVKAEYANRFGTSKGATRLKYAGEGVKDAPCCDDLGLLRSRPEPGY